MTIAKSIVLTQKKDKIVNTATTYNITLKLKKNNKIHSLTFQTWFLN